MSRHDPTPVQYNNRFGSFSGTGNEYPAPVHGRQLNSISEGVDMIAHKTPPVSPQGVVFQHSSVDLDHPADHSRYVDRMTSFENPIPVTPEVTEPLSHPMSPGKPRRLSRQLSADCKRHLFAMSHKASRDSASENVVTSIDSGHDDVFVGGGPGGHPHPTSPTLVLPDTSLFRKKSVVEVTLSSKSSASLLPNPYNRINHTIHSLIWCCNCFYIVFFCCLPAIHYMEQGDVQYNRNNHKRAKSLGRTASFLFFTGTLITLSLLSLIFFFVIFFSVYD
ncbi:hypothetical protein ACOMHN_024301 [Nucella lapillus]